MQRVLHGFGSVAVTVDMMVMKTMSEGAENGPNLPEKLYFNQGGNGLSIGR